ncbi:MAG: type II toxin-antitoxin system Phd/YefM family antitoxin [Thermodesulfovibrionia bacterium]|nr:type II toxin-antitoxin system Phd/YefM family antitoxin [Thermodesulfovibrionia bacterium]
MAIKIVTISDGKKYFTGLIKESVAKNEAIVITKRGHPVAALLPYKEYSDLKKLRTYQKMLEISKKMQKTGIKAKDVYAASKRELEGRGL